MRNITLDLSGSKGCSPKVFVGYEGEHNATKLIIVLPDEIVDSTQIVKLTPKFLTAEGEVVCMDVIEFNQVKNKSIELYLTEDVANQGRACFQIEAENADKSLLIKSNVGILIFRASVDKFGGVIK